VCTICIKSNDRAEIIENIERIIFLGILILPQKTKTA
jgi:hypothetical protein